VTPRGRGVVPVVTTGLHCGGGTGTTALVAKALVVPVVTTGLHCGDAKRVCDFMAQDVVPVVTTGLHCGIARRPKSHYRTGRSSPSSRRGSIAAYQAAYALASGAGVVPVVTTGLHCGVSDRLVPCGRPVGRPRRHDGAPLRRIVQVLR